MKKPDERICYPAMFHSGDQLESFPQKLLNDQTRQFVMMHVNKWEKCFKLLTV